MKHHDQRDDAGLEQQKQETPAQRKKKRIFLWAAIVAACVVIVVVCVFLLTQAREERSRLEEANQFASAPTASAAPSPSKTSEPSASQTPEPSDKKDPDYRKEKKENERAIDFAKLQEQNADVIAWIEIPGTQIDYPVVTTTDNEHYLDYDFQGQESAHGAIFLDAACDLKLEDPVSILYGHNMKDGTMFAGLHAFSDPAFLKEHPVIKLYTPQGQLDYKICAVYETSDEHLLYQKNLRNPAVYQEFLDEIAAKQEQDGALIDMGNISVKDSLLTLSTCVRGEDEKRFIVQAVFVKP